MNFSNFHVFLSSRHIQALPGVGRLPLKLCWIWWWLESVRIGYHNWTSIPLTRYLTMIWSPGRWPHEVCRRGKSLISTIVIWKISTPIGFKTTSVNHVCSPIQPTLLMVLLSSSNLPSVKFSSAIVHCANERNSLPPGATVVGWTMRPTRLSEKDVDSRRDGRRQKVRVTESRTGSTVELRIKRSRVLANNSTGTESRRRSPILDGDGLKSATSSTRLLRPRFFHLTNAKEDVTSSSISLSTRCDWWSRP